MQETTQAQDDQEIPTAYGWCWWHKGYSGGVRLIGVAEQGSGPGFHYFACSPCRDQHNLVPFADRP